jgi:hypothetical protein
MQAKNERILSQRSLCWCAEHHPTKSFMPRYRVCSAKGMTCIHLKRLEYLTGSGWSYLLIVKVVPSPPAKLRFSSICHNFNNDYWSFIFR